jgi:two-component system, OmpR family, response regulator
MADARILLVEDEALVSMALEAMLEDAGYRVIVAPDGAAALAEFQREPWQFDCLITDIWMPGMDGWTVAERVREVRPGIPVIYTTGDSDDEWRIRGVPNSTVLNKPFALDDAIAQVADAIGRQLPGGQVG